ncbi:MAG: hypothetical protein LBM28_02495 [Oscillospiraceae bacterium]|jgi:hypothetical protein|nr:hypothetical protein [Oscillospiraceae bacterium]
MVKGNTRQAVVVKSPNPKLFEQAIFLLKDDASGLSEHELMQQAIRTANQFAQRKRLKLLRRLHNLLWAMCGAGGMGLLWLMSHVIK